MFLEWEKKSGKLQIISGKFQNNAINDVKQISLNNEFRKFIKEINFSDAVAYKTPTGKLETKSYKKDTNRQAYLHSKSEHPECFKCNIPFAQTLRLRRICTADKEFQLNCNELQQKLTEWGHKGHIKGRK